MTRKTQASQNQKRCNANSQSQRYCTTFAFAPTHPSPPTTLTNIMLDSILKNKNFKFVGTDYQYFFSINNIKKSINNETAN